MGNKNQDCIVKIIASPKSWIEGKAIEQLNNTARLPGMKFAVGLPDLHPGSAHPVGAVFISQGIFYPQLAGSDIGCGMGFWQTSIPVKKVRIDKFSKKLKGLNSPCPDLSLYREKYQFLDNQNDHQLGTIGGGNHFAELQKIEMVQDSALFETLDLNENQAFLLVHSGSRALGKRIYENYISQNTQGLEDDSSESSVYLAQHEYALKWAKANREIIGMRFAEQIGAKLKPVLDICHNEISKVMINEECFWFHRKGASTSQQGPVVIPGSRGHFSYLVQPINAHLNSAFSLAHGAGRKWQRSAAKGKLQGYSSYNFRKTLLKSNVICEDEDLIFEEAPQAYKNIEVVIQDLIDEKLIKVIAILRPLITYKTRKEDGKK